MTATLIVTAVLLALSVADASRSRACPLVKKLHPYAVGLFMGSIAGVAILLVSAGIFVPLAVAVAFLAVAVGVNAAARGVWALSTLLSH